MHFYQTDIQLYAKYKWEFLRRNNKYKNESKVLLKQIAEGELVNNDTEVKKTAGIFLFPKITDTVILPKVKSKKYDDFCFKWDIKLAVNPSNNYEEIIADFINEQSRGFGELGVKAITDESYNSIAEAQFKKIMFPESLEVPVLANPFTKIEEKLDLKSNKIYSYYDEEYIDKGIIRIEINLNFSKKALIDNVLTAIDHLKEKRDQLRREKFVDSYCSVHNLGQKNLHKDNDIEREYIEYKNKFKKKYISPKYHFDNFALYLKAYDLKESGASWSTIVRKMKLSSIQTARNYYNAATRMIDKGIKLGIK